MGKPFRNFVIAVTGDFGPRRDIHKMKTWIQVNGGTFSSEVSANVTHLVCSQTHFKKNVKIVQQARKLRTVKIVTFDWLEDSLMKQTPLKTTRAYLLGPLIKAKAEAKAKKKAVRKKNIEKGMETFEKGCKDFEKEMHSKNYAIYTDPTQFAYSITLARANLLTNKNVRYNLKVCPTPPIFPITPPTHPSPRARIHTPRAQRLQLYVSHAVPKYYAVFVRYSAPGEEGKSEMLAPVGSCWESAWDAFRGFFELKTGRGWEGRFVRGVVGEGRFVYTPPREGEARGLFLEGE